MTIEEKLEKYRDEFLECKTPEAFLAWGRKWRELITDEEMADKEWQILFWERNSKNICYT